jgi:cyanophycinase
LALVLLILPAATAVAVSFRVGVARAEQNGALLFAGGELRFDNAPVWERFVTLAGGKCASVVVMPTAAEDPMKSGQATADNLRRYGANAEMVLIAPMLEGVDCNAAAKDPDNLEKLRRAKGIWFTGGEQLRITKALLNTPALAAISEAYHHGAVIGGTSAGTAIMSKSMFADAMNSLDTLKHGITEGKQVAPGLGFIGNDWFVDQHFLTRGRFARALNAMRGLKLNYGIGVDEDTAVVFKDGKFEVIGYKGALVLDIRDATSDPRLPAFNMKNARLTYLDAGDSMDANTREVILGPTKVEEGKVDPQAEGFKPNFDRPEEFYFPDMCGAWAIYEAMSHAVDSRKGVVKGLAFALPEGGDKNDLGFDFTVYRGGDTKGWYTSARGYETYTLANVHVDITPVKLARPLYTPLVAAGDRPEPPSRDEKGKPRRVVLVIHGGAGVLTPEEMKDEHVGREDYEEALARALRAGYDAMKGTGTSVDGVEAAVRVMEDSELFNAGRGAAFNSDGRVELGAAIMEGNMDDKATDEGKRDPRKRAGAVAAVTNIKNPFSAARAVMEMDGSRHVLLVGPGAEWYALSEPVRSRYHIERVSNLYLWTERRLKQIQKEFKEDSRPGKAGAPGPLKGDRPNRPRRADLRLGTVGAIALDRQGHLAAGTSTGGLTNKMPGRVGDSPVIGAGTYADDRACAASCTGTGEVFIRHPVAHDVVARMLYAHQSVGGAVEDAIDALPDEKDGVGGLIALDKEGRHAFRMSQKSVGMYRGYVTERGDIYVAIFFKEEEKLVTPAASEGEKAKDKK